MKAKSKKKSLPAPLPYDNGLMARLKDPEYALEFLMASWDLDKDPEEEFGHFLSALEQVVKAHGVTTIADEMEMTKDTLYKIFSDHQNPRTLTMLRMLQALGMSFQVVRTKPHKNSKRAGV